MKTKISDLINEIDNHIKALDAIVDISKECNVSSLFADAVGSKTDTLVTISNRLKEIVGVES